MARIKHTHNSFSTGVVSKDIQGNVAFEGYINALDCSDSFVVHATGGLFKRPGTKFVSLTYGGGVASSVLVPYSWDGSSCILELAVASNKACYVVCHGGRKGPFVLPTNLAQKDVENLRYFHQGGSLYFLRSAGIAALERTGDLDAPFIWRDVVPFSVMPFTYLNKSPIGVRCTKAAGAAHIGAGGSEITVRFVNLKDEGQALPAFLAPGFYLDDHAGEGGVRYLALTFQVASTDETKFSSAEPTFFLKIQGVQPDPSNTAFNMATCVIDKHLSPKCGPSNSDSWLPMYSDNAKTYCDVVLWRISAFSPSRGMPKACTVFEGRLFLGNNAHNPVGLWGSSLFYEDFFNFTLGGESGDALQAPRMDHPGEIHWLAAHTKLFSGTAHGIYLTGSMGLTDEALTPKSFSGMHLLSKVGASKLQPVAALDAIFFVDNYGTGLYEIVLTEAGVFRVHDLSMLSRDITRSGIVAHTWQQSPLKTYWAVLGDGRLAALTYLKNNNIVAWGHHTIGGVEARVTSIATIPAKDSDRVWLVVERKINDNYVRTIEYLSEEMDETMEPYEAHCTDGGSHTLYPWEVLGFQHSVAPTVAFVGAPTANIVFPSPSLFMAYSLGDEALSPTYDAHYIRITGNTWKYSGKMTHPDMDVDYMPNLNASVTCPGCALFLHAGEIIGVEPDGSIRVTLEAYIDPALLNATHSFTFSRCNLVHTVGTEAVDLNAGDNARAAGIRLYRIVPSATAGHYTVTTEAGVALALRIGDARPAQGKFFISYSEATLTTGIGSGIALKGALKGDVVPVLHSRVMLDGFAGSIQLNKRRLALLSVHTTPATADRPEIHSCRVGDMPVIEGVAIAVPLDSTDVAPYTTTGSKPMAFSCFRTVAMPDHFANQLVDCFLNGGAIWQGTVGADGVLRLPYECYSASVGFPIKAHFTTVPFYGGSMLGSSEGSVSNQRAATFRLYRSLGGRYGATLDETYPIPYRHAAQVAFDTPRALETTQIRVPMSGLKTGTYMDMTFSMVHNDPTPFAVLNVTREIEVSDA